MFSDPRMYSWGHLDVSLFAGSSCAMLNTSGDRQMSRIAGIAREDFLCPLSNHSGPHWRCCQDTTILTYSRIFAILLQRSG